MNAPTLLRLCHPLLPLTVVAMYTLFCLLDLLAVGLAGLEVAPLGGVAGELESRHAVGATHPGVD